MSSVDTLVQQAIAAVKTNRRNDARRLLEQAIEIDQYNEQAWLYLSGCVDSVDEQKTCLENVLAINPNNPKALKGLEILSRQAAPPGMGSPSAGMSGPFGGDPFAGSPFNEDYSAPPPMSTSVEWGRSDSGGSGGRASLSDEEYDQWLANLPLGGIGGAASSPAPAFGGTFNPASGPFSTPVDYTEADPYAAPPAPPSFDTFSTAYDSEAEGGFPGYDTTYSESNYGSYESGFDSTPVEPVELMPPSPADGTRFSFKQANAVEPQPTDRSLEDEILIDDGEDMLRAPVGAYPGAGSLTGEKRAAGPFSGAVIGSSLVTPSSDQSFRLIPAEIQVNKGGSASISTVAIVAGLAVLNVVSLIVLLVNLAGLGG